MPVTKSILRYPGGKSQMSKYVEYLLKINNVSGTYIEPFAGGFGVALYLLFNNKIEKVVMNDLDPSIFSVWNSILNQKDELVDLIKKTDITIDEWEKQRKIRMEHYQDPYSIENAFATLFLNRTNVSGIITGGPIGGKKQAGKYKIDCRFNKDNLIKKIDNICQFRDRIILSNLDANDFIKNEITKYNSNSTFIFFDPPYYRQGRNLYLSFVDESNHKNLANNILSLDDYKWITTYDTEDEILNLYSPHVKSYKYHLNYSANKKRHAEEYLFASNNTKIESFGNVNIFGSTSTRTDR